ncbi:hypothetical protein TNCV_2299421 [Trichonephila clavipes]|nr:hypothetical protein TNCV_2299421 [Trichonephila clavipes]
MPIVTNMGLALWGRVQSGHSGQVQKPLNTLPVEGLIHFKSAKAQKPFWHGMEVQKKVHWDTDPPMCSIALPQTIITFLSPPIYPVNDGLAL